MTLASATRAPKLGNRRVTGKEQYYTPRDLADRLVAEVAAVVPDLAERTVLEPAGGTGAFVDAVLAAGVREVVAYDIEPHHDLVRKANFLATKLNLGGAITISNPPFGRNNSLSIPFFNHAAESSEVIAFIVPRSWRKWSVLNRLDRRFELVADHDLAIDYVDVHGDPLSAKNILATCFQIWRRAEPGRLRPLLRVTDHGLVKKVAPSEADVAITVFGFNCGRVRTEFERLPNTTQLFLKLDESRRDGILAALNGADFERFHRNTAYTPALSLQEINYLLNERVLGDPHLEERN
jgi:hypothetical protein